MQQSSSSSTTTLQSNAKHSQENNNFTGQSEGLSHLQQFATTQRAQEQLFRIHTLSPHDSQSAFTMMEDSLYPNGANSVPQQNIQRVPLGTINSTYTSQMSTMVQPNSSSSPVNVPSIHSTVSTNNSANSIKRPLLRNTTVQISNLNGASNNVANSMLAMRKGANENESEDPIESTASLVNKKQKVSRERQLKINAASRRCRKRQKLELQFLRVHVVELQNAIRDQVAVLQSQVSASCVEKAQKLSALLKDSMQRVEEMTSGVKSTTCASSVSMMTTTTSSSIGGDPVSTISNVKHEATSPTLSSSSCSSSVYGNSSINNKKNENENSPSQVEKYEHDIIPNSPTSLNDLSKPINERRDFLLNIASFIRVNISLESRSFSPDSISCLPIEMDGWQLRLSITEKNYTIHNTKFFPCDFMDMYDFCWETNVSQRSGIKKCHKHFCMVTPLDKNTAHLYSKTIGKWSLEVHGVPNVSYNSLVCRIYDPELNRALICQQSVLEQKDFEDENTIPWLFKRWVVFQPHEINGIQGTLVEAYRTASYATGRMIYKENNTYDSFCEHLIRRYAESNSLLERMMARDQRFQKHIDTIGTNHLINMDLEEYEETTSNLIVKDLLLF
jgi:hypothetical protein